MPSPLFSPTRAGAIDLATRIVMAPLTRNRAPGATPTPLMAEYYAQRANPDTGAGLIISEATAISPQGQGYADVPGLYGTEQLDGWKKVTQAVHAQGGKIVCQLWHVGRVSHHILQPGNADPVAPSAIRAEAKTCLRVADGAGADLGAWLDAQERLILVRALDETGFNRTAAAARLGLNLRQMRYRMARLGITAPSGEEAADDGA